MIGKSLLVLRSSGDARAKRRGAMPTFEQKMALLDVDARETFVVLAQLLLENFTRVRDLFASWDLNKDGHVSRSEWWKAVRTLGLQAEQKDVDALFNLCDTDGSGYIEHSELNELLRHAQRVRAKARRATLRLLLGAALLLLRACAVLPSLWQLHLLGIGLEQGTLTFGDSSRRLLRVAK